MRPKISLAAGVRKLNECQLIRHGFPPSELDTGQSIIPTPGALGPAISLDVPQTTDWAPLIAPNRSLLCC